MLDYFYKENIFDETGSHLILIIFQYKTYFIENRLVPLKTIK